MNAISILELHIDKIDWTRLSSNSNAIHILEKNIDKIDWRALSFNSSIFIYNYDFYKKRMDIHCEELMKKVFHPHRLAYYLEMGYDSFD